MKKTLSIITLVLVCAIAIVALYLASDARNKAERFRARTADINYEVTVAPFQTGTTTTVAKLNPFNASSTIDQFIYDQTGVATSTGVVTCGTSTNAYITPSDSLIDEVSVATSTKYYIVNGVGNFEGDISAGTNSKNKIFVKPSEWVVCQVTTVYSNAFTNAASTFAGTFTIKWFK